MNGSRKALMGRICVCASAVIFGFVPVLASLSYRGGNNGINMAFLRATVPIPVLLLLCIGKPWPNKKQWKSGLLAGLLSFGCTLMLYSSYEYITPGLATMLHFLYPVYVSVYEAIRDRRWPPLPRLLGLFLGLGGCLLTLDLNGAEGNLTGYILAIASGIAYAAYIIALGREAREPMPLYRLMTTVSVSGIFLCGTAGLLTQKLVWNMQPTAWLCAISVTILTAVIGCVLFQKGVRDIGEGNAALYSLFEPVTSVLFSAIFLGENLSARKMVACVMILTGLVLISLRLRQYRTIQRRR